MLGSPRALGQAVGKRASGRVLFRPCSTISVFTRVFFIFFASSRKKRHAVITRRRFVSAAPGRDLHPRKKKDAVFNLYKFQLTDAQKAIVASFLKARKKSIVKSLIKQLRVFFTQVVKTVQFFSKNKETDGQQSDFERGRSCPLCCDFFAQA